MYYDAFFPFKSVNGDGWRIACYPAARPLTDALSELMLASETILPLESEFMMLMHSERLVVAFKADVHPSELEQYTQKLTRAAVLSGVYLTPSSQTMSGLDLSTLSL